MMVAGVVEDVVADDATDVPVTGVVEEALVVVDVKRSAVVDVARGTLDVLDE